MVFQNVEVEKLKTKGVVRDPGRAEFRVRHPGGETFSCWQTSDLNSAPVERLATLCAGALNFCL